ncbi:MAG TPA: hypothetical protein PK342_08970, partial [Methylotenera sp.]|nr:hypothetical protein [Methylotenera sp.]
MLVKSQNFNGSLGQYLMRAKNTVLAMLNQKSKLTFVSLFLLPLSAMAADAQVTTYGDSPNSAPNTTIVTYTLVVDNSAPDAATGVVVNATVPAGMLFDSATGGCSYTAPNVTCTIGTLVGTGGGGSATTITILMRANLAGGGSVNSTASVTSTNDTNPDTTNNSILQTTTITAGADLVLTVADSPSPVNGSGVITYTLSPSNNGPDGTTNARIVNTLPAGVSFISAVGSGWSCSQVGQVVTCNRSDTQPVGAMPQLVIQARVNQGSGTLANTATLSSPVTPDGITGVGDDTINTNTPVNPGADLAISKAVSPNPVIAGQLTTFTLNTANNGPSQANTVQVADTLPTGFTTIAASGPGWTCSVSGQDVTCDRATYAAGANSAITITATAPASVPPTGLSSSNTATIASATYDGIASNNSNTVNFNINPLQADLSLTKNKTPSPVAQGSNMTSTIVVHNNGPLNATSPVGVTDTLAAGETFVSATGTNWTCSHSAGVVSCSYVNLPINNDSTPLTIVTTATAAGVLTNTACTGTTGGSTHPEGDVNAANDCQNASANSTGQIADLSIVKSIPVVGDNPLLATDNNLTYRLTISNAGPNDSTNVVITDAIPMYTSLAGGTTMTFAPGVGSLGSAAGTCGNVGANVTCNYPLLKNNETAVIDVILARPLQDGAFTNTANITSTSIGDPAPGNNSGSISNTINPVADVEMTAKYASPDVVKAGVDTSYTISFRNNGPSTAQGVVVTDVFNPAGGGDTGFTVISISPSKGSCSGLTPGSSYTGGQTLTCNIGNLTSNEGQSVIVVIRPNFMVSPPPTRSLTNTAVITTTTRESDGPPSTDNGNNHKSASLDIQPASVDMTVDKTDSQLLGYGPDPIAFDPA